MLDNGTQYSKKQVIKYPKTLQLYTISKRKQSKSCHLHQPVHNNPKNQQPWAQRYSSRTYKVWEQTYSNYFSLHGTKTNPITDQLQQTIDYCTNRSIVYYFRWIQTVTVSYGITKQIAEGKNERNLGKKINPWRGSSSSFETTAVLVVNSAQCKISQDENQIFFRRNQSFKKAIGVDLN